MKRPHTSARQSGCVPVLVGHLQAHARIGAVVLADETNVVRSKRRAAPTVPRGGLEAETDVGAIERIFHRPRVLQAGE